jgi:hypothetical protein
MDEINNNNNNNQVPGKMPLFNMALFAYMQD